MWMYTLQNFTMFTITPVPNRYYCFSFFFILTFDSAQVSPKKICSLRSTRLKPWGTLQLKIFWTCSPKTTQWWWASPLILGACTNTYYSLIWCDRLRGESSLRKTTNSLSQVSRNPPLRSSASTSLVGDIFGRICLIFGCVFCFFLLDWPPGHCRNFSELWKIKIWPSIENDDRIVNGKVWFWAYFLTALVLCSISATKPFHSSQLQVNALHACQLTGFPCALDIQPLFSPEELAKMEDDQRTIEETGESTYHK